ncbi:MAG: alpha-L-fucosidase [Coprobacter sp.]|nr:alpha-L-fucosidase [Coprobacter sp.]
MIKRLAFLMVALISINIAAEELHYYPTPENLERRKEFADAKFGIFIHWGIYSMMGDGEWVMTNQDIKHKRYSQLVAGFYPSKFNAKEWIDIIKGSGAKYLCFTSRHHDGFSMFHSDYTDYNIVDATPFKRDVLKELAEECNRQDIKLHLYYSHIDWGRDDFPVGGTGQKSGRDKSKENWSSYYSFMNNQLTELLTNYGEIGAIWFDGVWDKPDFDWQLEEQYKIIHSIQPQCLIANNHHKEIREGEDFQIFERDLPGENTAGYSEGQQVSKLPLESCQTMNNTWGYNIVDDNYKSTKDIIHFLLRNVGMGANLLLNVGPGPDGSFPEEAASRLKEIGEWLEKYGESVYGTTAGVIPPQDWGVTTMKNNTLYVHILNLNSNSLHLPIEGYKVENAVSIINDKAIKMKQDKKGITLYFDEIPSEIDHIIKLKIRQKN